ncbi:hypothetical protein [Streptomyces sp. NPDC001927]
MLVRPVRKPWPAVAALVAGALLACAYLMWGPGHGAMVMADTMPGMTATNGNVGTAAPPTGKALQEVGPAHGGCPDTSMDCPLANAHPPSAVGLAAAPGPEALAEPRTTAVQPPWASGDGCAWPRAPDPVALLCVSRT